MLSCSTSHYLHVYIVCDYFVKVALLKTVSDTANRFMNFLCYISFLVKCVII